MGYIGMSGPIGYGIPAILLINRVAKRVSGLIQGIKLLVG